MRNNNRNDAKRTNNGPSQGFRNNFKSGPREMHPAKCSKCGKDCEVPFKPTQGKPVYCRECYQSVRDQ